MNGIAIIVLSIIILIIVFLFIEWLLRKCDLKIKKQKRDYEQEIQNLTKQIEDLYSEINLKEQTYENTISLMQANEEEAFTEKLKDLKAETCVLSNEKSILMRDIEEYKDLITQKEEESQRLTDIIRAKNEAIIRERQLQEEEDKYFIPCSAEDKDDITYLEGIKPRLHNPRILSMLIWQTFYQKKLTSLCNNLLGTKTVCGIYKITDKIDSRCYIGQARDVSTRWKEHVKCGCGIDTPANHKLYEAMQKDGIWNFSFELLEECPKEQLNAREKDYIEIYDSYNYGFNQNRGISK